MVLPPTFLWVNLSVNFQHYDHVSGDLRSWDSPWRFFSGPSLNAGVCAMCSLFSFLWLTCWAVGTGWTQKENNLIDTCVEMGIPGRSIHRTGIMTHPAAAPANPDSSFLLWFDESGNSIKTRLQLYFYTKNDIWDSFIRFDIYYGTPCVIKYTQVDISFPSKPLRYECVIWERNISLVPNPNPKIKHIPDVNGP